MDIQFDISFYLVAGAGGMSVISAACNLLRRHAPLHSERGDHEARENLLDDYEGMEFRGATLTPDYYAPINYVPPPPAYSP